VFVVRGAEAPIIVAADMFSEVGLYYRAHANNFNPLDPTSSYTTGNRMGIAGPEQLWDFLEGPTNEVFRFDYLSPTGMLQAADFPDATLAERKTVESSGATSYLFFRPVPDIGRRVYGFYDPAVSAKQPSTPFSSPIVDFPATIRYNDTWSTSMTYFTEVEVFEVGGFPVRYTVTSQFRVDAWGVVMLPGLGPLPTLRINEDQTVDVAVDLDGYGEFTHLETDYTRNYYWLSPGRGIVAQMNSIQSSSPPPENFDRAASFVRMFETNKKPTPPVTGIQPVTNLRLTVGNGLVIVQWTKAANASQYRVEYSTGGFGTGSWQTLGTTSNASLIDWSASGQAMRFYRVASLP
jgi:hypothetical protein